ncbi:glycosyltransferase [Microbacterium sp.]|uniref:glycosyltransferase n=1 Tax=Microbacterium sp. TaxID=51671 RepID=UPI002C39EDDA|nr:glycosyltransferase [Microbacterium sp.]HWK76505.1 glycosyltransferase [Microbacterium sp.]
MVSVIIAAHNEESVIERCLGALHRGGTQLQIIVSANGCTDATAELARSLNTKVVERSEAGKAGALNAAEEVATSFPRVYLDADILVPHGGIAALTTALDDDAEVLATMPRRRVNTAGRPWAVQAYFRINQRLPVFRSGLFGRGLIVLSESGRARFGAFPDLIADDLFLDGLFAADEKLEVPEVEVVVEAPWTTADLLNRLVRVRRGNTQMRRTVAAQGAEGSVRSSDRWSWLRDVVLKDLRLAPSAAAYVAITVIAGVRSRRTSNHSWGHDASTRIMPQTAASVQP